MDGTGLVSFTAAGDIALPGLAIDGVGQVLQSITGTGALTVGGLVIDGAADNGDYVVPVVPGARRRRLAPQPVAAPVLVGSGAINLASIDVEGQGRYVYDDLWLFLEPSLYLAGVVK